jgi:hypothetical protein
MILILYRRRSKVQIFFIYWNNCFYFALQKSPNVQPPSFARTFSRDDPIQMPENPEDIPPPDPAVFGAPPPPATVEEALQQRLAKYREDEAKAKQVLFVPRC